MGRRSTRSQCRWTQTLKLPIYSLSRWARPSAVGRALGLAQGMYMKPTTYINVLCPS